MTDTLARRLEQLADAGLYRLPDPQVADIEAAARAAEFATARANLAGCIDKAAFLREIARALEFPDWFGHNWDALADCLTDLSWLPARGYVLILEHADALHDRAPTEFATALEILADAVREWACAGKPMWVFVGLARPGAHELRSL